jgi:hypothetical protein
MIALLALASIGEIASGCRSSGSMVHCDLAAPAPFTVTPKRQERADHQAIPVSAAAHPSRRTSASRHASPAPDALAQGDIDLHIASLVAIQDCTGARAFARSVGASDLGDRTFAQCVGGPIPVEARSAAPDDGAGHRSVALDR